MTAPRSTAPRSTAETTPSQMISVGRITSVYGIKGWVKIESSTEPKANIFGYQPWYISTKNGFQKLEVDDYKAHGKVYTGHISGVDDRDVAQAYCRKDICVDRNLLPELTGDEFYWHQLEGLRVYSLGSIDSDNVGASADTDEGLACPKLRVLLGEVKELMETGANDVLVVACCQGSIDRRERLVPWLDEFLHRVDLDKGEVEVYWDPEF